MAVENMLSFTVENVINCVHNERIVWDSAVNGSAEQKELAWHRIAECLASLRVSDASFTFVLLTVCTKHRKGPPYFLAQF